jgi:hypothetical protein
MLRRVRRGLAFTVAHCTRSRDDMEGSRMCFPNGKEEPPPNQTSLPPPPGQKSRGSENPSPTSQTLGSHSLWISARSATKVATF